MSSTRSSHFNPRARVGRDSVGRRNDDTYCISIHAPAWGATIKNYSLCNKKYNFNPRARVGRDECHCLLLAYVIHFNPRARVGRDDTQYYIFQHTLDFNPRARVGRDSSH